MSTHAIVWFDDEDILGLEAMPATPDAFATERRWPRVKIDLRIRVTYSIGSDTETTDAQANDVSEGGMAAYIPAELHPGDNVVVEIVRRYGRPRVSFSAKINNRNGFRYGLEFAGVGGIDLAALVANITDCTVSH